MVSKKDLKILKLAAAQKTLKKKVTARRVLKPGQITVDLRMQKPVGSIFDQTSRFFKPQLEEGIDEMNLFL